MSKLRSCVLAVAAGLFALLPAVRHRPRLRYRPAPRTAADFAPSVAVSTESIASLMATQGAINLAENRGFSIVGEAKLQSCTSTGIFGVECAATSYACKLPH